jgi:hypothetical protein
MDLRDECILITRHLIDTDPSVDLIERFVAANRVLFHDNYPASDLELRLVHRNPRVLPFVDAAAALLNRDSIVRKKIYLMSAILEASPVHADFFLKQPDPPLKLLMTLAGLAVKSLLKTAVGIPILLVARRQG